MTELHKGQGQEGMV